MLESDVNLLLEVLIGFLVFLVGFFLNNPRARAGLKVALSFAEVFKECRFVFQDGTVTLAEEQAIGRRAIEVYRSAGTAIAVVEGSTIPILETV